MPKSKSPFPPRTDFFTKHGAGLLVEHILSHWQKRGYQMVQVERFEYSPGTWGVRSNLVAGLPPYRRVRR